MAYQIIISDEVFDSLNSIVLYLETKWSKKIAKNFLLIFYEKVDALAIRPNIGKRTIKNPAIRKILITKHNMLYYEVTDNSIELLSIFYTVQDPAKNKME
jgi:plasmid stabilization system protein ParE